MPVGAVPCALNSAPRSFPVSLLLPGSQFRNREAKVPSFQNFPPGHRPCCRLSLNSRPPVPVQTPPQGLPSFLREGVRETSLRQGLPAARGCRGGPGSLPTRRVCSPGRADVFWRQARELAPRQLPGRWLGSPCSRTLQPLWAQSPKTAGIQGACTQPCGQALAVWAAAVLATARPPLLPEPTPPGHRLQRDHPALPKRTPRHRTSHDPPEGRD